ncbi:hypothetical protein NP493_778g03009 [Ridgeia piscesae]|uniref:Uncharacterized protein n=1 Tax=Ridgeia piscesae TaxID=27915 RepID=A0AAD9KQG2_RIDPI|nr:hypothetical protein NP493_778g03009 [Ridgeia piscesae]
MAMTNSLGRHTCYPYPQCSSSYSPTGRPHKVSHIPRRRHIHALPRRLSPHTSHRTYLVKLLTPVCSEIAVPVWIPCSPLRRQAGVDCR